MNILFIIDAPNTIKAYKDTSVALMLEGQKRLHNIYICEQSDLWYASECVFGKIHLIEVQDSAPQWFHIKESHHAFDLSQIDLIFMRKDPPFDLYYIYTTYLLDILESKNTLIINKPSSLRDCNEKLFTLGFTECIPPTLVSAKKHTIIPFVEAQKRCVLKPLNGMAGQAIYKTSHNDHNLNVILEQWTRNEVEPIMVQKFIPQIQKGDKRIFLINGIPVDYALLRQPTKGEFRGNLSAGGTAIPTKINKHDKWICKQIGPTLIEKGLWFAGIDVIGKYLTEINITSPTCMREIERAFDVNIAALLYDALDKRS